MSDTPRTDLMVEHAPIGLRTNAAFEQSCDLCRTLERELNAAIKRIDFVMDCNADVKRIAMERNEAIDRIKRLEEAGDEIIWVFCKASVSIRNDRESEALKLWIKARGVKL